MDWISTKDEMPKEYTEVFALINGTEPIVAFYGSFGNERTKVWRNSIGDYTYPEGIVTHFMYIHKPNKF